MLDKIRSAALEGYVRNKYGAYLQSNDFTADLNTRDCYLKIGATLAGEDSRIEFSIDKFEIRDVESGKVLIARAISCNKPWLLKLAEDKLLNKAVKLPSFVAGAL